MSEPVTVSVPSLLSVDLDEAGRVKGWRVVEGVTTERVQRSVETARIWNGDDALAEKGHDDQRAATEERIAAGRRERMRRVPDDR